MCKKSKQKKTITFEKAQPSNLRHYDLQLGKNFCQYHLENKFCIDGGGGDCDIANFETMHNSLSPRTKRVKLSLQIL